MKIIGHNLDEPGRKRYAQEIGLNGVVNHEIYYTQGGSFFTRMLQLKKIGGLLRIVGFKREHHRVNLWAEIDGFIWPKGGVQAGPYSTYINGNEDNAGTCVEISPHHDRSNRGCHELAIDVIKTGSFDDYLWTCNLFRKFFGLDGRLVEGNEKRNV